MSTSHWIKADILALERRYRAQFVNSLSGFKGVNMVGTVDTKGQTNLAIVSSVVHLGSNPALFGMVMRPHTVARHTLENLLETGFYTLNHLNEDIYPQAHHTSARYPKDISEFNVTRLTPLYTPIIPAPYVQESHIRLGLAFKQKIDIELNGTVFIIGELVEVHFPTDCLTEDGFLDIKRAGSITVAGLDAYHSTNLLERLPYAKPHKSIPPTN